MAEWATILIGIGVIFFILEMIPPLPSGGLLGLIATLSLVGGIICLYTINTTYGLIATAIAIIVVPAGFVLAMQMFPHTRVGKMMILNERHKAGPGAVKYDAARDSDPQALVGSRGKAISKLRPVGICSIDGKRMECMSVSGVIESGADIEVVAVQGMRVRVRDVS